MLKERLKLIRIIYLISIITFFASSFIPYLVTWDNDLGYLSSILGQSYYQNFMNVFFIIVNLIISLVFAISILVTYRAIRLANTIAGVGIIVMGIFFFAHITTFLSPGDIYYPNNSWLSLGFYIGIISYGVIIWMNVLLSKYEKARIKSLIATTHIKYVEIPVKKSAEAKITGTESPEVERGIVGFFSYSMRDSELFNIKKIAESLTSYKRVDDILWCEEDTRDNFIKYMDQNIGKCDVMILFCSPNALKSGFVEDEWMAAHAMKKPIIPVFLNIDHVPPLLRARIGVEFDVFNLKKNIKEIYKVMEKKLFAEEE
ncbi:MAG: toll/interleukin-1 receptor domain-containing protein [Promethearchaeota archaeon]